MRRKNVKMTARHRHRPLCPMIGQRLLEATHSVLSGPFMKHGLPTLRRTLLQGAPHIPSVRTVNMKPGKKSSLLTSWVRPLCQHHFMLIANLLKNRLTPHQWPRWADAGGKCGQIPPLPPTDRPSPSFPQSIAVPISYPEQRAVTICLFGRVIYG